MDLSDVDHDDGIREEIENELKFAEDFQKNPEKARRLHKPKECVACEELVLKATNGLCPIEDCWYCDKCLKKCVFCEKYCCYVHNKNDAEYNGYDVLFEMAHNFQTCSAKHKTDCFCRYMFCMNCTDACTECLVIYRKGMQHLCDGISYVQFTVSFGCCLEFDVITQVTDEQLGILRKFESLCVNIKREECGTSQCSAGFNLRTFGIKNVKKTCVQLDINAGYANEIWNYYETMKICAERYLVQSKLNHHSAIYSANDREMYEFVYGKQPDKQSNTNE